MAIVPHGDFANIGEVEALVSGNAEIKKRVEGQMAAHRDINIAKVMQSLEQVGQLLRVAYAGAKGHPCSAPILSMFSNYQSVVKDSSVTLDLFVGSCLSALRVTDLASEIAESGAEGSIEKAVQLLEKCSEQADKMAVAAQEMVDKAQALCTQAKDALDKAQGDELVSVKQKKAVEKLIADTQVLEAKFKQESEDLSKAVAAALKEEKRLRREEAAEREKATAMNVLGAVAGIAAAGAGAAPAGAAIGGVFAKEGEKAEEHAESLAGQRAELAKKREALETTMRDVNSNLAQSITKLKNSSAQKDELAAAIESLGITLQTLTKVKTAFENVRVFWAGVKNRCTGLAEEGRALKSDDVIRFNLKARFLRSIDHFKISWMALGRINVVALRAMDAASASVDKAFCEIPTLSESQRVVREASDSLLKSLEG